MNPGKQSTGRVGFGNFRKQRAAYGGVWRASALGHNEEMTVSGSATKKLHITSCPVYSNWYEYFMKGLEKCMGRDTK